MRLNSTFFKNCKRTNIIVALILFVFFAGYYAVILYKRIGTDIQPHAAIAFSLFNNNDKVTPNFLYFFLVGLFAGFSKYYPLYYLSSVILLSGAITAKFVLVDYYIRKYTILKSNKLLSFFLAVMLLFVFALPGVDFFTQKNFYFGQIVPTVWHNSTVIFLMPFALLLFFKSYRFVFEAEIPHRKDIIDLFILIILNLLIKPSFLFTLLPAVFLLLSLNLLKKGKWLNTVTKLFPYIAGLVFILAEYYVIYRLNYVSTVVNTNGEGSGVVVTAFELWGHYSKNIPVAFLSSLLFPVVYFMLQARQLLKNKMFCFSALNFIIGIAEWCLLAEKGLRKFHGNFFWQVVIATFLLFLVLVIDFLQRNKSFKPNNPKKLLIVTVFALHFLWGIFYWAKIIIFKDYN